MANYLGTKEVNSKRYSFNEVAGAGTFVVREEDGVIGIDRQLAAGILGVEAADIDYLIQAAKAEAEANNVRASEAVAFVYCDGINYLYADLVERWVDERAADFREHRPNLVVAMVHRYEEVQGYAQEMGGLPSRLRIWGTWEYANLIHTCGGAVAIVGAGREVGVTYEVIDFLTSGVINYGTVKRLLNITRQRKNQAFNDALGNRPAYVSDDKIGVDQFIDWRLANAFCVHAHTYEGGDRALIWRRLAALQTQISTRIQELKASAVNYKGMNLR